MLDQKTNVMLFSLPIFLYCPLELNASNISCFLLSSELCISQIHPNIKIHVIAISYKPWLAMKHNINILLISIYKFQSLQ